jgi:hypothetical protein
MSRTSSNTSRLPQDVLSYTRQDFIDFIRKFCGDDEADLLSVQAIRSVDSFLAIKDLYSIFSLDSEDVEAIKKQCGFKKKDGTFIVKPGIKSSLEYVATLLEEKKKECAKTKKTRPSFTPRTAAISSSATSPSSSSTISPSTAIATAIPFISKKTEAEYRLIINNNVNEWCIQQREQFSVPDLNLVCDVDYHLEIDLTLGKASVKCSCGSIAALFLCPSGNFKVKTNVDLSSFFTQNDVGEKLTYFYNKQCTLSEEEVFVERDNQVSSDEVLAVIYLAGLQFLSSFEKKMLHHK